MILELFITFIAISFALMFFGIYSKIRLFSVVGLFIIFLLGAWVMLYDSTHYDPVGLQYSNGSTIVTNGSTTTVSDNLITFHEATTFWIGLLLTLIALFGFWLVGSFKE